MSSQFSMEEVPLNQIFQKAVVLQRSGDRDGALDQYKQFLKVAESHDVDPSLYVSLLWFCCVYNIKSTHDSKQQTNLAGGGSC